MPSLSRSSSSNGIEQGAQITAACASQVCRAARS
jgi:hypothetical protein